MDAVAELPADSSQPAKRTVADWGKPFTKQNAAEYALKAVDARMKRLASTDTSNGLSEEQPKNYVQLELARTREQIKRVQKRLDELVSGDPRDLKAVTDALFRLREIEQRLDNRPLPGSRRPGRESTSKPPSTFEPSE